MKEQIEITEEFKIPGTDIVLENGDVIEIISEGYLSKSDYERRNKNILKRNEDNFEIALENGMTEEQADAIIWLCAVRHDIHTFGTEKIFIGEDDKFIDLFIGEIKERLNEVGFKNKLDWEFDLINLPSNSTLDDDYDLDSNSENYYEEYDNAVADAYDKISDFISKVNDDIEKFLNEIDKKYKTKFAPTGAWRVV